MAKIKAKASRLIGALLNKAAPKCKFQDGDWVRIQIPYSSKGRHVDEGQTGIVVGQPRWSSHSHQYMLDVRTKYEVSPFKEDQLVLEHRSE